MKLPHGCKASRVGRTLGALLVVALGLAVSLPAQAPDGIEVILLGTGFPRPHPERAGPATAVVVNGTFLERAGKHFQGKIVVGRDLMRF